MIQDLRARLETLVTLVQLDSQEFPVRLVVMVKSDHLVPVDRRVRLGHLVQGLHHSEADPGLSVARDFQGYPVSSGSEVSSSVSFMCMLNYGLQ